MTFRLIALAPILAAFGCGPASSRSADSATAADSAFAAVQTRGAAVMGVNQYDSQHVFEDLPNGGRIVLERQDSTDSAGIAMIRQHMWEVAADFRAGNFRKPFRVHGRAVPGTDVMAARHTALSYVVVDRPRGAEVRITTGDSAALAAVHAFLAFQRSDHRAGGHEGHSGH